RADGSGGPVRAHPVPPARRRRGRRRSTARRATRRRRAPPWRARGGRGCRRPARAHLIPPGLHLHRAPPYSARMVIRPGVSAVILRPGGVLLQRRSDNGLWGLPGGGVEPGESVREAVAREVREETGLEVEPLRVIGVYSAPEHHQIITYPDGNVIHYVSTCFECAITGGTLVCGEESLA